MARIAKKDTYGIERVGGGVEVRRRVVAGQRIPDHYDVPAADIEDRESPAVRTPAYPEGQVTRRITDAGTVKKSVAKGDAVEAADRAAEQATKPPRSRAKS